MPNKLKIILIALIIQFSLVNWSIDVISVRGVSQFEKTITTSGTIINTPLYEINIDLSKNLCSNQLLIGFNVDFGSSSFISNPQMRQIAANANFKIIRFYDTLGAWYIPFMMPCSFFNESTQTGTYNWTNVDDFVQKILHIGAEPLITLGTISDGKLKVPNGMALDPTTNLPKPESYAAYTAQWVSHFKEKGWSIRYYEIVNEPWLYFGWDPINYTRLSNYMQLFNACSGLMRQESSDLIISFDFIGRKPVLDYWLANGGADVDSINFHKYDDYNAEGRTNEDMLNRAETQYFETWPLGYNLTEAQQEWFAFRGKLLPIICSESNFNSAFVNGTDPRIQQMVGAVWTASVLRMEVLTGVSYNIYYELAESANYGRTTQTGGYGFGMINSDDNQPWYPYYVNYVIGNNLGKGDLIKESTSSSEEIKTLSWVHEQTLNILIICQVDQPQTILISGVEGPGSITKIDGTISWENPQLQNGTVNFSDAIMLNGYTVALLQKTL
jgi:hypothetical protein